MAGAKTKPGPTPKAVTRAPKPSGGSFVGLDIGSQMIKVVEVTGSGNGLRVTAFGQAPTPFGTISQGIVSDPKTLGAAVKALLAKSGVKSRKSVSAASGAAAVVVRVIEVPKMSPSELAETMKWEVERHIPFSPSEVELSYQKIDDPAVDNDDANPNMEVLLACAQRDMVSGHLDTLKAAGLTPSAIDVEPLAAGRALLSLSKQGLADKNAVVVNIGSSMTDVGIFKKAALRFPRTIPIGGDNFTQAIADRLGIPMDAAEDEKKTSGKIFMDLVNQPMDDFPGSSAQDAGISSIFDVSPELSAPLPPALYDTPAPEAVAAGSPFDVTFDNPFDTPSPEPEPVAETPVIETAPVPEDPRVTRQKEVFYALNPVLGEFAMELQRSIDYFRSKYPSETIDQVLLCGGSASLAGLAEYVQYQTGIPASVADPFAGVNVTARQLSLDQRAQMAPALAVAMGLAARDAVLGAGR